VKNYFRAPHEQWQNGLAKSTINAIMLIARTVMVESGLGGQFWFKAAMAGNDALNEVYKEHIKTSPHQAMYGEPKDVSRFRAFRCKVFVYLNKDSRENGKHTARGVDAINLGLAQNSIACVLYIPKRKT
jgi:hypothetical protein